MKIFGNKNNKIKTKDLAIKDFEYLPEDIVIEYKITDNIWITFVAEGTFGGNNKHKIGIETDLNSGGFVTSIYVTNIQYCISDKEKKWKPIWINTQRGGYC